MSRREGRNARSVHNVEVVNLTRNLFATLLPPTYSDQISFHKFRMQGLSQ